MCLLVYCFVYLRGEVGLVHIHVIFVDSLCFFSFTASEHVREDLYGTGSGLELIIYVRSWHVAYSLACAGICICTATAIIKYKIGSCQKTRSPAINSRYRST